MGRKNKNGRNAIGFNPEQLSYEQDKIEGLLEKMKWEDNRIVSYELSKKMNEIANNSINESCKQQEENINVLQCQVTNQNNLVELDDIMLSAPIRQGYFIENDQTVRHLAHVDQVIDTLLTIMTKSNDFLDYALKKRTDADKKIIDIEHDIELKSGDSCYQTWALTRYLKYSLTERRDYKDISTILQVIKNFTDTHSNVINELRIFRDKLKTKKSILQNRIYYPRSDLKLAVSEKFYSLSEEDQEIVRRNYELSQEKR